MSSIQTPVLAGNWKMHHGPDAVRRFFEEFRSLYPERRDRTVVFFPPAISLPAAVAETRDRRDLLVGAQNVHWEEKGAFTGEISAGMAAAAGARMALVGHSERRQLFGETDEETALKVRAVHAAGLLPVLCVGETLEEREAGRAREVVRRQLDAVLENVADDALPSLLIAYEPVWAIGTGRTASPADAEEMHGSIRALLNDRYDAAAAAVPILYGGSVKPDNARDLLSAADVDGVLVGGASLQPADFERICRSA